MRRRPAYSIAESLREGAALVHSSRRRKSQAAGAGVMAGSKAGSAKCAARERRSHRHVSPKRLVSPEPFTRPSSRRRGVYPGGLAGRPARVPPRGSSPCSSAGRPVGRPDSGEPPRTRRAGAVHPEVLRRQERSNVRPCWNRAVAGILTGPSGCVTQRGCEDPQNASGNNDLHAPRQCASWVSSRTSRIDALTD